jgi:Icc-related predicted phosphoesterase
VRKTQKWTPEECKVLESKLNMGKTNEEIGNLLGRSRGSVMNKIAWERKKGCLLNLPSRKVISSKVTGRFELVLGQATKIWTDFLQVNCKETIVTSDWHIPYINIDIVNRMLQTAKRMKIKTLVIAGDFLSLEVFAFWTQSRQHTPSFVKELSMCETILDMMLKWFEWIIILPGNHERRYWRALDGRDDFTHLMQYLTRKKVKESMKKIELSYYSYIEIKDGINPFKWRITHQKNYSKNDLAVPRQLSHKFSNVNILCAHTHHCCLGHAQDGNRIIGETGCMTDAKFFEYMMKDDTTSGAWTPGFITIQNGQAIAHSGGMGFERRI